MLILHVFKLKEKTVELGQKTFAMFSEWDRNAVFRFHRRSVDGPVENVNCFWRTQSTV